MRFLADQGVYAVTLRLLQQENHDVVTAAELDMSESEDIELLQQAHQDDRLMLTRDRDYGRLVFHQAAPACGVIYLRITPRSLAAVHMELLSVLDQYREKDLRRSFVVVEGGRHRLRRPSPQP